MSGKTILIAGGGPAGALCGERLARAGFRVILFEERQGWEKPCGGGVTWKTLRRYPFLLEGGVEKKLLCAAELIAPNGRRVHLALTRPLAIYSRAVLNGFLLDRARAAGAELVGERVTKAFANGSVRIHTPRNEYVGDFLVIATGARNALTIEATAKDSVGAWKPTPRDLELTVGYYLPQEDNRLRVAFLDQFEGYLWSFPRPGHLSVGICGKLAQGGRVMRSAELRQHLDRFLARERIPAGGGELYSHLLPSLARPSWDHLSLQGPGWARLGDAAGLVDPVTGEGIYYALRSGELLADALSVGEPQHYANAVHHDFAEDLAQAARWQRTFYRGKLLGAGVTTRMLQLLQHSPRFAALIDDLFAGTQPYRGLKWRLARIALPSLMEILSNNRSEGTTRATSATSPF